MASGESNRKRSRAQAAGGKPAAAHGKRSADLSAHFEKLIDSVNDAIIARDADLVITTWNKAAERMYGWTAEEMVGKAPLPTQKHGYRGIEQPEILDRLNSEGRMLFETIQERKDGTTVQTEVTAVALKDEGGKINGYVTVNRDISDRKRYEGALSASDNRLRSLIDVVNEGILITNAEGALTFVNARVVEMLGYARDEVIGRPYTVLLGDEEAGLSKSKYFEDLKLGKTVQRDVRYLRKDGSTFYARVGSSPFYGEDGKFAGVISVAMDISEHVKFEEDLKSTRSYLENLVTYANAPIIVWDPLFRITRFNRAFERLTDRSASEVMGQELSVLFPKWSMRDSLSKISQTIMGERFDSVEIPILRKDGTVRIVLWNSANIYSDDEKSLIATIAQGQDITERKIAEEALKTTRNYLESLIDYANAPIVVWDPSSKVTRFNHAFETLTGYWSYEVIGKDMQMLFPEESSEHSMSIIKQTLEGQKMETVEIPILRKDSSVRIALWNSANIYADDGKSLIATIAQGQDITDRKRAEEKTNSLLSDLARKTAELEVINKELEAFNYSVSHDLRAPLRAIDGFSTIILDDHSDKLDGKAKEYLGRMCAASKRMDQILDDLLRLSRVSRDRMVIGRVNLSSIAKEVVDDLRKREPGRKVDAVIAENVFMQGDERLMRIFMENLIGNSWKFTSKNEKARIEFGFTGGKDQKVFFVKDNGAGFDMKHVENIFKPFHRLHSASEFSGTGIGLATAMRIIGRHSGKMWAEGEVGKGATIYFTKPEGEAWRASVLQTEAGSNPF